MPLRLLSISQALLLMTCVMSIGCSTYRRPPYPAMWEIEQVALGKAQAAYLAKDGSILVRYHIQRTRQPGYTGFHWLVIEPHAVQQVLKPKAQTTYPSHGVYQRSYARVRSEQSDPIFKQPVNARMIPPILEPGLPDDIPPAGVAEPVLPLIMVFNEEGRLSLRDPAKPETQTRLIDLWPTIERYQTERGAANEKRYRTVTWPINKAVNIVTSPCALAFKLYLDWWWSKNRI